MKSFFVLLFFNAILLPLRAQSVIDSLHQLYAGAEEAERQSELAEYLTNEYVFVDMDSARVWLEILRGLATEHQFDHQLANVQLLECRLYSAQGAFAEARPFCERGLEIAWQANHTDGLINGYINLSEILQAMGRHDSAIDTLLAALRLTETEHTQPAKGTIYASLGMVYEQLSNYEKALEYLHRAAGVHGSLGNYNNQASNYYFIGTTFNKTEQLDSAEHYLLLAQKTAGPVDRAYMEPYLYNALGSIHATRGEHERSLEYNLKSLPIFEERGEIHGECSALRAISRNYIKMGQPAKALPLLERARPLAEMMGDVFSRSNIANLTAEAHAELKNYRRAYQDLRFANTLADSVFSQRSATKIAEAETKYRTEIVERDLKLSEQVAETQAVELVYQRNRIWWLIALASLAALLAIGAFVALRIRKRKNELIERQSKDKELLLRELHHRVKNNLSVISGILSLQSHKTEDSSVRRAINDSRTRVEAMGLIHQRLYQRENLTTIEIRSYIEELSEMIFDAYGFDRESARLVLDVEELQVDVETAIPLGLIINEVISNTFKHGFPEQGRQPEVRIVLEKRADQLHLQLSDNGVGLPENFEVPTDNPRTARTFGTQLLSSLARQLDATLTIGQGPGSTFDFLIRNFKLGV